MPIPPKAILTGVVKILVVGYVSRSDFFDLPTLLSPQITRDRPWCCASTWRWWCRAVLALGVAAHPEPLGMCDLLLELCFRELGLICVGLGSTSHVPSVQQLTAVARPVQTSIATPTSTSHLQTSTNPPQHATTHTHGLSRSALAVCTARTSSHTDKRWELHEHERWCCGGVWGLHM